MLLSLINKARNKLLFNTVFLDKQCRLPSVRKFLFCLFRTLRSGECFECSVIIAKHLKKLKRGVCVAYLRVYG